MALLTLIQSRGKFSMRLPHNILINGQLLGMMRDPQVTIRIPAGQYDVTVQSMIPFISATHRVTLTEAQPVTLSFRDREQVWDTLFVIDFALWILKRFLHLSNPWSWMYEVFTNGYFLLWLLYEWRIRKQYFKFHQE